MSDIIEGKNIFYSINRTTSTLVQLYWYSYDSIPGCNIRHCIGIQVLLLIASSMFVTHSREIP